MSGMRGGPLSVVSALGLERRLLLRQRGGPGGGRSWPSDGGELSRLAGVEGALRRERGARCGPPAAALAQTTAHAGAGKRGLGEKGAQMSLADFLPVLFPPQLGEQKMLERRG